MIERSDNNSLTEKEFSFICQLVYDKTGIVLGEKKKEMVYRRLMRRIKELGIASFSGYCDLLKSDDSIELPNFINAITTNLTSFYREEHHFTYLNDHFLPAHKSRFSDTKRLRVWSAACSTGEEPYTLAITLCEFFGSGLREWDVKILATDLDSEVLSAAKNGVYKFDRIEKIPTAIANKYFFKSPEKREFLVKVKPELQGLITFKQLNFLEKEWPMRGPFDIIMCRNVLIYFDRQTQDKLIGRFSALLRPGGLLLLGHSESISKDNNFFSLKGRTIFEKR